MCGILVTSGIERPFHHRLLKDLTKRGLTPSAKWPTRTLLDEGRSPHFERQEAIEL